MSTRLLIFALAAVAQCSTAAAAEPQPGEARAVGLPASYKDHPLYNIYAERVSMFATLPRLDGGIAFVGDSLTDEGRWAEHYHDLRVANLGISGDNSEVLSYRAAQVVQLRPGRFSC